MYLKSIEIQGFKSFAHKTLLNFEPGVTAIVGPNGSGKSNISDAVRWVLGEQRVKSLRGLAMQDVIFSGTELRRPQGYAFVSITLDNSDGALPLDYSEISVSRRLFRSGESEYKINNQSVRMRDIQELFFDTGIGKEGYSIIGQGRVEAILNGKPEERRGIFDEAAGIVKYKKRKQTALRKLESETMNLGRITDILTELEDRIEPLRRQYESAKKYLGLREEQKRLELTLFASEAEALIGDLEKIDADIGIIKDQTEEAEKEKKELFDLGEGISAEIIRLSELIEEKKNDLSRSGLMKENLKGQIDVREAEMRAAQQKREDLSSELSKLDKEKEERILEAREYYEALTKLEQSLKEISQGGGEEASEAAELLEKTASFKALISACAEDIVFPSSPAPKTREEDEFSYTPPEWLMAIKAKKDELSLITEKEERNAHWLRKAEDEYNELTLRLRKLQQDMTNAQKEYMDLRARYDTASNLAERYEGFGESVKNVMNLSSSLTGIRGVVADILRTEPLYEQAIETALGGRIQNIVTDTEEDAKAAIEYLRKNKKGRATFLPLDAVKGNTGADYRKAAGEAGAIGIAADLVKADEEYEELVRYLLGSVLVVDHIDHALLIAGRYRHSLRIVTLDAELLTPGGAISGGAYKNSSNLLGRARELDTLRSRRDKAKQKLSKVNESIRELEEIIGRKNEELDRLNAAVRDIDLEKQELSIGILSDMKLKLSELRQKTGFIEENLKRIENSFEKAKERKAEILSKTEELLGEEERLSSEIEERHADILAIEQGRAGAEEEIGALTLKKDELSGSESERYHRREELDEELLLLGKELLRLDAQREKRQQKMDEEAAYIWDEYGLSLSDANEVAAFESAGMSALRSGIAKVKEEIRSLGLVNVQAIEEYRTVSERYEFLKSQQRDLIESADEVRAVIDDLNARMKSRFRERFKVINDEFSKVFSELFSGGSATLKLDTTAEDELDAGILISAEPPGKKLQNIVLLSGGEKALTAIALLFAMQNLSPSPFCLLDEIDAALDDSNVIRFADYLGKLGSRTQFIVISHKRGTMESADRLYGVTMEERGVSKLVSVELVSDRLS